MYDIYAVLCLLIRVCAFKKLVFLFFLALYSVEVALMAHVRLKTVKCRPI